MGEIVAAALQIVGIMIVSLLAVASLRVLVDLVRDGPGLIRARREAPRPFRMSFKNGRLHLG